MRFAVVAALVLGIAAAASAQPADPSAPTPVVVASPGTVAAPVAVATPHSVMANRWAIDVGLGLQALNTTSDNIGFVTYELGVRFRIIRALEVALTFGAGGNHGDEYSALWADLRYNFMAERPWNIYVHLGIGAGSASGKNASDGDNAGRGTARLGAGLERRFDVFSISAELRLLTFGTNNQAEATGVDTPESDLASEASSGLGLLFGSTYYF